MQIPSAQASANKIVDIMHSVAMSHAPISISLGKVKTPPPKLTIEWNGIILEPEQLYVDTFLLKNYKRSAKGARERKDDFEIEEAEGEISTVTEVEEGGEEEPSYEAHEHELDEEDYKLNAKGKSTALGKYVGSAIYTDYGLEEGDLVAILPMEGGQKFIVLAKLIYMKEYDEDAEPGDDYEGSLDGEGSSSEQGQGADATKTDASGTNEQDSGIDGDDSGGIDSG